MKLQDAAAVTRTPSEALVLALLDKLYRSSTLRRDGVKYTAPKLSMLAEQINLSKPSLHRIVRSLQAQGLIEIVRGWWNRSPRLYFKVLVDKFRGRNPTSSASETSIYKGDNAISPTEDIGGRTSEFPDQGKQGVLPEGTTSPQSPPPRKVGFRGKVADAGKRAKERVEKALSGDGAKVTPTAFGHRWNGYLRREGYPPFPMEEKELSHVRRTLVLLGNPKTLDEAMDRLRERLDNRALYLTDKERRMKPHPWVVNRHEPRYVAWLALKTQGVPTSPPEDDQPATQVEHLTVLPDALYDMLVAKDPSLDDNPTVIRHSEFKG